MRYKLGLGLIWRRVGLGLFRLLAYKKLFLGSYFCMLNNSYMEQKLKEIAEN